MEKKIPCYQMSLNTNIFIFTVNKVMFQHENIWFINTIIITLTTNNQVFAQNYYSLMNYNDVEMIC